MKAAIMAIERGLLPEANTGFHRAHEQEMALEKPRRAN
jgi:hypothetical protein